MKTSDDIWQAGYSRPRIIQDKRANEVHSIAGWAVGILAIALCVGAASRYWEDFTRYNPQLSAGVLITGLACILVSFLVNSAGWFMLMSSLGSPIRFFSALRAYSYSLIASYIPGKVFVLLVRIQACKEDGASPSKVFAATALEIILGLVCSLTIWLSASYLILGSGEFLQIGYLSFLLLLLAALHPKTIMALMKLYYRLRRMSWEQEMPLLSLANIAAPAILYFAGWVLYGLGGFCVLRAVVSDPPDPLGSAVYVAGISNFAWAVGHLFFIAPGGLGATEGAFTWLLQPWLPLAVAVVISLLARICRMGTALGLATVCWVLHRWRGSC